MSKRYDAFGTQLQVADAGGLNFTTIAGLTNIEGPGGSREVRDATAHDSPGKFREKLPGFVDGGQVTLEGYYDPADATHDEATGLSGLWKSGEIRNFKIIDVDDADSETTFSGFVSEFSRSAPFEGMLGFSATIEVTGVPVFP